MLPRPHRIRRGRRTDFVAVMEVLSRCDLPTPPPDRATLRRFRNVVADLGNDLYVATIDEQPVGVVHVTYARQITTYPLARIELVAVVPEARRQGVGASLLRFIADRARQRDCVRVSCDLSPVATPENAAFFSSLGWSTNGHVAFIPLAAHPESSTESCK